MCKARLPLPDFSEHPADASNAAAWQCLQCGCIPSAGPESLLMVFFVSRQTIQLVFDYNGRERRPSSPGLALSCKSAMHPRHTSSGNHVIVACPSSFAVSALHVPLSCIVACSRSFAMGLCGIFLQSAVRVSHTVALYISSLRSQVLSRVEMSICHRMFPAVSHVLLKYIS